MRSVTASSAITMSHGVGSTAVSTASASMSTKWLYGRIDDIAQVPSDAVRKKEQTLKVGGRKSIGDQSYILPTWSEKSHLEGTESYGGAAASGGDSEPEGSSHDGADQAMSDFLRKHGLAAYASELREFSLELVRGMDEEDLLDLCVDAGMKKEDRRRFMAALERSPREQKAQEQQALSVVEAVRQEMESMKTELAGLDVRSEIRSLRADVRRLEAEKAASSAEAGVPWTDIFSQYFGMWCGLPNQVGERSTTPELSPELPSGGTKANGK